MYELAADMETIQLSPRIRGTLMVYVVEVGTSRLPALISDDRHVVKLSLLEELPPRHVRGGLLF